MVLKNSCLTDDFFKNGHTLTRQYVKVKGRKTLYHRREKMHFKRVDYLRRVVLERIG